MAPMISCAVASPSALLGRMATMRSATAARAVSQYHRSFASTALARDGAKDEAPKPKKFKPRVWKPAGNDGPSKTAPQSGKRGLGDSSPKKAKQNREKTREMRKIGHVVRRHIFGREYFEEGKLGPASQGVLTEATPRNEAGDIVLAYKGINQKMSVPALALRDSCACPQCVTPSSGQKTFHTHDLPAKPEVKTTSITTDPETGLTSLQVVWAADETCDLAKEEHTSVYDTRDLIYRSIGYAPRHYPGSIERRLWDRQVIEKELKPVSYADWMAADDGSNTEFYRGLLDLHRLGIVIVDGVPETDTAVREIAEKIGNIQNTFYGELFDVVSKPNAENVAYTNVFLCLHQDLLYMNDPPYIQLLHCLRNECDGGESLFSDSLRAAIEVEIEDSNYAKALSQVKVPYHYERNGHYYYNSRPVIELEEDPANAVVPYPRPTDAFHSLIKFTGWSPPFQDRMPILARNDSLPRGRVDTDFYPKDEARSVINFYQGFEQGSEAERLAYWHKAAKCFSESLERPDAMLELKLQPGQCVLFDNRRVLHGRRQFNTSDGTRHLKGTYIDEQTFKSRLAGMIRLGRMPAEHQPRAANGSELEEGPHGPVPRGQAPQAAGERNQVFAMHRAAGRPIKGTKEGGEQSRQGEEAE